MFAYKQWQQSHKLNLITQKHNRNFLEDVFEAWKQKVAFKGGHSIHNRALKEKVWTAFVKNRKAWKVKLFRIG